MQGLIPETYVEIIDAKNASKPTSPTSPTVRSPGKPQISPRQKPQLKSKSSFSTPESPIMADRGLNQAKIKACALYTWQPSDASKHLKMKKGDIINVVEQREKWWAGKIDKHVSKNLLCTHMHTHTHTYTHTHTHTHARTHTHTHTHNKFQYLI